MSCLWCHNPESQYAKPQLMFYEAQCIGCRCVKNASDIHLRRKTRPNTKITFFMSQILRSVGIEQMRSCAENCPSEALRLCGRAMTVQEVMTEIEKGCGLLLLMAAGSLSQEENRFCKVHFLKKFFQNVQKRKFLSVLTTLEIKGENRATAAVCRFVLVDVKILNPEKASVYQGICYKNMPKKNLKRLSDLNIPVIIRVPLAKGINDTPRRNRKKRDAFQITDQHN